MRRRKRRAPPAAAARGGGGFPSSPPKGPPPGVLPAGRARATRGEKAMFITMRTRKALGEVRQRFEESAAENRFAVLGIHDVGERLRAKGLSFDRKFYVAEVCNPVAAKKVLDTNVRIGTALPGRVTIYTEGE